MHIYAGGFHANWIWLRKTYTTRDRVARGNTLSRMWNLGRKKMAEHQAQPNLVPDSLQSNPNEPQWYSSTDPKRRKVDQQVAKSNIDPHNAPTSRVVHGRAIPDGCTFQMILNVLQRFGKIT